MGMLVLDGRILEHVCIRYEYSAEEYVWPHVREVGKAEVDVPPEHLAIMDAFLPGYSGFCNFNYKLTKEGRMRIFEVNARVGSDFACDVPRRRAREMLERLDATCRS